MSIPLVGEMQRGGLATFSAAVSGGENPPRLSRACLLFERTPGAVDGEPVGRLSGGSSRQAICLSAALTDRGMSENPLFAETVRACQPVERGC